MIFDLGDQPWGNDFRSESGAERCPTYPLALYFCRSCTTVQIGFTVPKEVMFVDHKYLSGTTKSLLNHFEQVIGEMARRINLGAEDYILDIGGNDGTFLGAARRLEARVVNVESGTEQARIARLNGVPTINRFFDEAMATALLAERGHARVIHGSGIFFHLEQLHSVFDGIKRLLSPDGLLIGEFIYLPEMVEKCAFDQIYHEHLLYYRLETFDHLLRMHGLAIEDAIESPIHGGSRVAFIRHLENARPTRRLEAMRQWERAAGFDRIDIYLDFAARSRELARTVKTLIAKERKAGRSVQALGAPVKGTTIVHFCGLDEQDLDCAVEINPLKVGTWVPGTRIPVKDQRTTPPPDAYLLLAWNFREEILASLRDFRGRGGRILIPIPNAEIV